MRFTPAVRLLIESGIIISLLAGAGWFSVIAYKVDAQAGDIETIKNEQKVIGKDLVETQKQMIRDLTEIKTILKEKKR